MHCVLIFMLCTGFAMALWTMVEKSLLACDRRRCSSDSVVVFWSRALWGNWLIIDLQVVRMEPLLLGLHREVGEIDSSTFLWSLTWWIEITIRIIGCLELRHVVAHSHVPGLEVLWRLTNTFKMIVDLDGCLFDVLWWILPILLHTKMSSTKVNRLMKTLNMLSKFLPFNSPWHVLLILLG